MEQDQTKTPTPGSLEPVGSELAALRVLEWEMTKFTVELERMGKWAEQLRQSLGRTCDRIAPNDRGER